MIVVDTNLIAYLYLQGEYTTHAEQVLQRDSAWAVPLLWRSEFRNVLAFYLRQNLLSLKDAEDIMEKAEAFLLGREYEVSSTHVLRLANASQCSAYDCEFVSLAQELGVPLVTADRKVLKAFPQVAMTPSAFATSR
jgi:predicted nucleic acid-binding protein